MTSMDVDVQLAQQARQELEDVFAAASKQGGEPAPENPEGEGRPSKWRKDDSKQGKGPSYNSWDSNWSGGQRPKRHWKDDAQQEAGSGESKQTQELLKCLVKMTVRHEQELMRIRPDVGFIAFADTSSLGCVELLQGVLKAWQAQFEAGTVKTALKTILAMSMMKDLKERAEAILRDEEKLQRCLTVGWAVETETGLNPAWIYQTWDSKEKKQVRSEAPPLKHTEALHLVDVLLENLPREGVLTRFSCPKLQQETFTEEVIPVTLQLSLRGEASDACHKALKQLSGSAFMKLQGVRWRPERIQKPPQAVALEEAYLSMPYCDWSRRGNQTPWPRKAT